MPQDFLDNILLFFPNKGYDFHRSPKVRTFQGGEFICAFYNSAQRNQLILISLHITLKSRNFCPDEIAERIL